MPACRGPAAHRLGEKCLAVAGLLAHDAVELAEQLERHGAEGLRRVEQGHARGKVIIAVA